MGFNTNDLWVNILLRNLIKYFGAYFQLIHRNNLHHYWSNSESRFKILHAKGSLVHF